MRGADLARLVALAAMWGASYLFMRYAVPSFGPVPLIELRVVAAGLALLLFLKATGGVVGWPVHAPLGGEIRRVRTSGVGYGRSIYLDQIAGPDRLIRARQRHHVHARGIIKSPRWCVRRRNLRQRIQWTKPHVKRGPPLLLDSFQQTDEKELAKFVQLGESKMDAQLPPAQIAALTVICQSVLNLDATIMER